MFSSFGVLQQNINWVADLETGESSLSEGVFPLCPHMEERAKGVLWSLLLRALDLFIRIPRYDLGPSHFQRLQVLMLSIRVLGFNMQIL